MLLKATQTGAISIVYHFQHLLNIGVWLLLDVITIIAPIRITNPPNSCKVVIFCDNKSANKTTTVTNSAVHKIKAVVAPPVSYLPKKLSVKYVIY